MNPRVSELLALSSQARALEERAILRAILMEPDQAFIAIERFLRDDFDDRAWTSEKCRAIWKAIRSCRSDGKPLALTGLVQAALADKDVAALFADATWGDHEANCRRFLIELAQANNLPAIEAPGIPDRLGVMHEAHLRDQLRSTSLALATGTGTVEAVRGLIERIEVSGLRGGPVLLGARRGCSEAVQKWEREAKPHESSSVVPWRVAPLFDRAGAFIREGDFAIVAGRPGVGKTTLALTVARLEARRNPVLFVSLEMTAEECWQKVLAAEARTDAPVGRQMTAEESERFGGAWSYLERGGLTIAGNVPRSLSALKSWLTATVQASAKRPSLVVLDYLGLVQSKGDEYERVTRASSELRGWALNNVPMLCVSQVNRAPANEREKGAARQPRMSDLRGSGQQEQDATQIVLLGPYIEPGQEREFNENRWLSASVVEVLAVLAKARGGRAGLGQRLRFDRPKSLMEAVAATPQNGEDRDER